MNKNEIYIRKAVVHVVVMIQCEGCKIMADSRAIELKLEHYPFPLMVHELLQTQVGTNFPDGWGSFMGESGSFLLCPVCLAKKR